MDIRNFIYEQGILGVSIATLLAYGSNNFMNSIRLYILTPIIYMILNSMGIKTRQNKNIINMVASFIEFLITILIVFMIYKYIIMNIFKKQFNKEKIEEKQQKQVILDIHHIRKNMVDDVSDIRDEFMKIKPYSYYNIPKF